MNKNIQNIFILTLNVPSQGEILWPKYDYGRQWKIILSTHLQLIGGMVLLQDAVQLFKLHNMYFAKLSQIIVIYNSKTK